MCIGFTSFVWLVNDPLLLAPPNVEARVVGGRLFLVSLRPIVCGDELLLHYGAAYWLMQKSVGGYSAVADELNRYCQKLGVAFSWSLIEDMRQSLSSVVSTYST